MLHDKAIKAMHGLLQKLYRYNSCDPKVMLDVFDKMIMPIALYNSEIWGTMCFPVNEKNLDLMEVSPQKNPVEDIQIRFCKRLLGVNDKSTNWAVTSELGRLPTISLIADRMVKFWSHLIQSSSPILREALQVNINLDACGKRVWFTVLRRCLSHLGIDHVLYTSDPKEISYQVTKTKSILRSRALEKWHEKHASLRESTSSKLHLYSLTKSKFGYEGYLSSCTKHKARGSLTKVRISAHNMPIEVGRYMGMDRSHRVCPFCSAESGDEEHYLCVCPDPLFLSKRTPLFGHFENICPGFLDSPSKQRVIMMLSSTNQNAISKISNFCQHILEIFREFNTRSV